MLLSWESNTIKSARIYISWLFAQLFKYVLLCIKIYQGLTCKPLIKQHWYHKYRLQVSTETNTQYWFTSIHHCDSLNHKPILVITYKYCVFSVYNIHGYFVKWYTPYLMIQLENMYTKQIKLQRIVWCHCNDHLLVMFDSIQYMHNFDVVRKICKCCIAVSWWQDASNAFRELIPL